MIELNVRLFAAEGSSFFTFEEASRRLEPLPRLFLEPDGAFLWRNAAESMNYQLEGTLIDRGEALYYIELFGSCSADMLRAFLSAVAPDQTSFRAESLLSGEAVPFPGAS